MTQVIQPRSLRHQVVFAAGAVGFLRERVAVHRVPDGVRSGSVQQQSEEQEFTTDRSVHGASGGSRLVRCEIQL
ncbi:MAG TPA: hypothetical protein DC058_15205 [Planctomycetaceae bacterium]|nr:hypothetical protein [Planctomycetaceae bacterium]HBC62548.1 hypothetical protein [Planctomycetaceae bacterium]